MGLKSLFSWMASQSAPERLIAKAIVDFEDGEPRQAITDFFQGLSGLMAGHPKAVNISNAALTALINAGLAVPVQAAAAPLQPGNPPMAAPPPGPAPVQQTITQPVQQPPVAPPPVQPPPIQPPPPPQVGPPPISPPPAAVGAGS